MEILWAEQALTADGWAKNVVIKIGDDGRIVSVLPNQERQGRALALVLPAQGNLHSHTFQRALAGLTERRGPKNRDSFWTWRRLMYQFLEILSAADIEAIAAFAQMEMLSAGFASVGEFHYLHNQPAGVAYDDPAELSNRIFAATGRSGIGLTHLPVLYTQGGCDGRALIGGQLRFGQTLEQFECLLSACSANMRGLPPDCVLGVAPHSLRAVSAQALEVVSQMSPCAPVHIHVAEQLAEVSEVEAYLGARPVEYLLDNLDVNRRWCLVHATQMTAVETGGLATSGAVAGLCPITESNLGDGIFDGVNYLRQRGVIGLGTDSNILISLQEEIRTFEYSQRLRDHSRAVFGDHKTSTGCQLYQCAATGSAQALGRDSGVITKGKWADIVEIDVSHPDFEGLQGDCLLDTWLFARSENLVRNLWSAGRHLIRDGRHIREAEITLAYRQSLRKLRSAL